MDYMKQMNEALNYMEDNIYGEVDIVKVASVACCSVYNFQRLFSCLADISVGDYLRKRRMTLAAADLLTTDMKIIDIAMKYGYDSPISFARAFSSVHNINPSDVRRSEVSLKTYPRIAFQITVKGKNIMEYRIVNEKEIRVVGFCEKQVFKDDSNLKRIPKFWEEIMSSGKMQDLCEVNDNPDMGCLGICANDTNEGFDYYIATGSSKPVPEGMQELIIAPATYAVFTGYGQQNIQPLWKQINNEWMPSSGYDYAPAPQFEWYSDEEDNTTCKFEIWIPVMKRQ